MKPEEAAVLALLERRLKTTTKGKLGDSLAALGGPKSTQRRRGSKKKAA
jgi:hypothetical protein